MPWLTRWKSVVDSTGATTRDNPAKVCAIPIVVPSSDFAECRDIIAVVAGKSSDVPIGTSGTMKASDHKFGANGYAIRPKIRTAAPERIDHASPIRSTIGPINADRIRTEKMPTYRKTYPMVLSVMPNSALKYNART